MGGAGDTEGCGRGIRRVIWWIWRFVRGYEKLRGLRRYGQWKGFPRTNRAFWRHVTTSGGSVVDTWDEVGLMLRFCCAMTVKAQAKRVIKVEFSR